MRKYPCGRVTPDIVLVTWTIFSGINMKYVRHTPNCSTAMPKETTTAHRPKALRANSGYVSKVPSADGICGSAGAKGLFASPSVSVEPYAGLPVSSSNALISSKRSTFRFSIFQHSRSLLALYRYVAVENIKAGIATAQPASLNPRGRTVRYCY